MTVSDGYDPYYGNEDALTRRANDQWRNDPERREAARVRLAEISAAFEQAHEHLKGAMAAFDALGVLDATEDATAERCQHALRMTLVRFDRVAQFVTDDPNENLLGNKAAFGYAMKG